jgi:MinD-like ATPase involved in chromosome partitioning or flagellar assembly
MFTVTFYSFRGGVGRTMAAANVAYHLAREGYRVFLVDFDLEAPGLSLMPEFQPAPGQEPASPEGLIGYLRPGLADEPLPPIESLCFETLLSSDLPTHKKGKGSIHILPAGPHENVDRYGTARLHLEKLYETKARSLVPDALKVDIERVYRPDYLLVDSRTGLTEVGGICTVHLADFVVILFGLNRQNVEGTCMVLRRLRAVRNDFADRVLFVASPVPIGEEDLKKERFDQARKAFADALGVTSEGLAPIHFLHYHPRLALSEESFVAHFPETPLSAQYRRLARQIQGRNEADKRYRLGVIREELRDDFSKGFESLRELVSEATAPPEALFHFAILLPAKDPDTSPEPYFRRAVEGEPANVDFVVSYVTHLEKYRRFDEAERCFQRAIEADPKDADNLGNYALFLKKRERFDEAEQYYRRTIEADPKDADNLGNYALCLQ